MDNRTVFVFGLGFLAGMVANLILVFLTLSIETPESARLPTPTVVNPADDEAETGTHPDPSTSVDETDGQAGPDEKGTPKAD